MGKVIDLTNLFYHDDPNALSDYEIVVRSSNRIVTKMAVPVFTLATFDIVVNARTNYSNFVEKYSSEIRDMMIAIGKFYEAIGLDIQTVSLEKLDPTDEVNDKCRSSLITVKWK